MQSYYLNNKPKRHVSTYVNSFTINYLHYRNPWINAWWSMAFPGLGHLMLCKYMIGFSLIIWEVAINNLSGLNMAIFYSMTGEIHKATEVLSKKWFLMYINVYVFSIWDSYTRTVQYNKRYNLTSKAGYDSIITNISGLELNILVKRQPIHSFIWSFLVPGFGHLYINRIITTVFFSIWFIVINYFSNVLQAVHYTMILDIESAKNIIDIQWFLYYPSLYTFVVYDSYMNTVGYNRIYDREQAAYFKNEYQSKEFKFPL